MNFDELYEKYRNGSATEEERAYVESEISKARKLAAIIDEQDSKRVIEPAEEEKVKKSVNGFMRHTRIRIALVVTAILLLLSILCTVGFFAFAMIKASSNSVCTRDEAVERAKKWLADTYSDLRVEDLRVIEVDRDLALHHGLSRAYFEYDVEIEYNGNEYEFWIDSSDGEVRLVDRD